MLGPVVFCYVAAPLAQTAYQDWVGRLIKPAAFRTFELTVKCIVHDVDVRVVKRQPCLGSIGFVDAEQASVIGTVWTARFGDGSQELWVMVLLDVTPPLSGVVDDALCTQTITFRARKRLGNGPKLRMASTQMHSEGICLEEKLATEDTPVWRLVAWRMALVHMAAPLAHVCDLIKVLVLPQALTLGTGEGPQLRTAMRFVGMLPHLLPRCKRAFARAAACFQGSLTSANETRRHIALGPRQVWNGFEKFNQHLNESQLAAITRVVS